MASAKAEAHHDEGAAWKPSTGQKIQNLIRNKWCIGLIIAIVLVVILVPVLLLVVYPHIAQSITNKARIIVLSEAALSPTPDSIRLDINSSFVVNSKYHPVLYPFNASLYLDEQASTPFVSFETPRINHIKNGSTLSISQTVPIPHADAFTAFTKKALSSKDFTLILKGKGQLQQGGLTKATVTYNQKVFLTGLDGLSSIEVKDITLLKEQLSDGSNANASISLYNPSVFTLDLGDVSMSLIGPAPNNTALGTTLLVGALVKPRSNTLSATVKADIVAIANLITQDKRYGCAVFPVTIAGNNVTYNNVDIPYYTAAVNQLKISTTLNLTKTLQDVGYGVVSLDTHDD
ncbi:hypothetical protein DV736_g1592, partial [Chaetothyriales sp. CBS 134916]